MECGYVFLLYIFCWVQSASSSKWQESHNVSEFKYTRTSLGLPQMVIYLRQGLLGLDQSK